MEEASSAASANPASAPELAVTEIDIRAKCERLKVAWEKRNEHELLDAMVLTSANELKHVQVVIDTGAATILTHMLREYWRSNDELCFRVLWALTNLASAPTEQAAFMTNCGAMGIIRDIFIESPFTKCREQAAWCLANISGDSVEARDAILVLGIVEHLADRLSEATVELETRRSLMRLGANLCGKPYPGLSTIHPLLNSARTIIACAATEDDEVIISALLILGQCYGNQGEWFATVTDVLPALCNLGSLDVVSEAVLSHAIYAVRLIRYSGDAQMVWFLQSKGLNLYARALSYPSLRRNVCLGLRNIAVRPLHIRIHLVEHASVLNQLIQILETGKESPDMDLVCHAASVFSAVLAETPTSLIQTWLKLQPFTQVLLYCYSSCGSRDVTIQLAKAGLTVLLESSLSSCVREVLDRPRPGLRQSFFKCNWLQPILHYNLSAQMSRQVANDLIWLLLTVGLLDTTQQDDRDMLALGRRRLKYLSKRVSALRNITALVGVGKLLRHRLPSTATVWLPVDLWRLVWSAVFQ